MIDQQDLRRLVSVRFPLFGPNKQQEIRRLVFEIVKREAMPLAAVLMAVPVGCQAYPAVKDHLVARRFPVASAGGRISESFPALDSDPSTAMPLTRAAKVPSPLRVYVEAGAESSPVVRRAREKFPSAEMIRIPGYKEYAASKAVAGMAYNRRTEELVILRGQHGRIRHCPCSPGVVPCGYHNIDLGVGCPFECSYCFLQSYTNAPGIVIPASLDGAFDAFRHFGKNIRVGSGETTDSLVFDDLTCFSGAVVDFFRGYPDSVFEFKTKSANVAGLLEVKASSNIVVGWSLNPQVVIDQEEHFSASLAERLDAARRCAAHGYRVAFHFDPVIFRPGWEGVYASVVQDIFKHVPSESIAWISLGTLRMTALQKKTIENRFPVNTILDAELLTAEDGKLRYTAEVRRDIYVRMIALLREKTAVATHLYLCMETVPMWNLVREVVHGQY